MLKKLRAIAAVGALSACAGAGLGLFGRFVLSLIFDSEVVISTGTLMLSFAVVAGVAGSLFAIGLSLHARFKGRADKRLATLLGAVAGAGAFPLVAFLWQLPVSHWPVVNWVGPLAAGAYLGACGGRALWRIADVGEASEASDTLDPQLVHGPNILDETPLGPERARDCDSAPGRGGVN